MTREDIARKIVQMNETKTYWETVDMIVQALKNENAECAIIAWEFARGIRKADPKVGSVQQGDHIAAAIRARQ